VPLSLQDPSIVKCANGSIDISADDEIRLHGDLIIDGSRYGAASDIVASEAIKRWLHKR